VRSPPFSPRFLIRSRFSLFTTDDGKGGKNKTSEKRKLQNRQAQRNFRERKEKVSSGWPALRPSLSARAVNLSQSRGSSLTCFRTIFTAPQGARRSCLELGAADYRPGHRERRAQAAPRAVSRSAGETPKRGPER